MLYKWTPDYYSDQLFLENDSFSIFSHFQENNEPEQNTQKENQDISLNVMINLPQIPFNNQQEFQIVLDPLIININPFLEKIALERQHQVFQIQKQQITKKNKNYANKNFCRYILLSAFRTMKLQNDDIQQKIQQICDRNKIQQISQEFFIDFFTKNRNLISGVQILKKHLIVNQDYDSTESQLLKKAFQEYLIWYLENLGKNTTRHMLASKKRKYVREYLIYKNKVMTYYVRNPSQWFGNQAFLNQQQNRFIQPQQ